MSKVIIFHGTECKPEDFWYSWLKKELEEQGHTVQLPYYEDINRAPISQFVQKVIDDFEYDDDTVLVGHSAGVPLILSILERLDITIQQAVLVAGFTSILDDETPEPILQSNYNWSKIKSSSRDFVILNSTDDPWGCDDRQGRKMFDELGGTFIIRKDGHFGSSKDPDYKEFPLLLQLTGVVI